MNDDQRPDNRTGSGGHRPGRCPICRQPAVERYRPFCSKRCADIDLGRWLGERYRVPAEEAPDAGDLQEESEVQQGRRDREG
jgi:uncharacterized protein